MSATPEPVTLAREVLALAHEDETVTVCTIPDNTVAALARAVVATANLADRLDNAVSRYHEAGLYASMIRNALNGEHHE